MPLSIPPAASISPSPSTLAYIKEKTRGLHKPHRSSRSSTPLATPPATSPPNPVFHPLSPPPPSSSSAADAAIARLRLYAHEQLLLRTADEWHQRTARRTAIRLWKAHQATHGQLHLREARLRQRLRLRRLQAVVDRWVDCTRRRLQSVALPAHLTAFRSRHLQRKCLTAWVGYTLGRQQKQANATLASYVHRSTALQRAFHVWIHCTQLSQQQGALHSQAEAIDHRHVLREAWAVWTTELAHSSEEGQRERKATAVGDGRRRRYYFRQWRQLRAKVEADEVVASTLRPLVDHRRLRDAWAAWQAELQWTRQMVRVVKEVERMRQEAVMRGVVRRWLHVVEEEREEEVRLQRAMEWRRRLQRKWGVDRWRAAVMVARVEQVTEARHRHHCIVSLHVWHSWTQRRRRIAHADHFHRHHLHSHTLDTWLHALHDLTADRDRLEQAQAHWQRRALSTGLHHWLLLAHQRRQRSSDLSSASTHQRRHLLLSAVSALLRHSRVASQLRHHRSCARRHLLHRTVLVLRAHALAGRTAWQRFLAAKRHRYLHLLSSTFSRWQAAVSRIRAAEDALLQERCGGLLQVMIGDLFALWRAQLQQKLTDRQREGEALALWKRRLLEAGWSEWHRAVDERRVEKQRAAVADSWLLLHQRWRAVRAWSAFVHTSHRTREAETAAVHAAQHHLRHLATRRTFTQLLHSFHLARLTRLSLSRASSHHQHRAKMTAVTHWRVVAEGQKRARQMVGVAVRGYEGGLRKAAWARWKEVFAERRRVLALHLKALEWRRVREERRVWNGWVRWVEGRRAVKAREEEMRRLRLEKLRVEGCRQWIAVGLEWLARDAEEAREEEEERRRQRREARWRRHRRVQEWVARIARHWRRLSESRKEGGKAERLLPLFTPELLLEWRSRPPAPAHPSRSPPPSLSPPSFPHPAPGDGRTSRSSGHHTPGPRPPLTLASLSSSSTSAFPPPHRSPGFGAALPPSFAASSAPSSSLLSSSRHLLSQPRRNPELLAFDCSLLSAVPPLPTSTFPATWRSLGQQSARVVAASTPWPAVDAQHPPDAPLLPTSAASASALVEDVAAMESRLRYLAELRSRYRAAAAELAEVQRRVAEGGERMGEAEVVALQGRARLLRESMEAFEQRRPQWKAEVAAVSERIARAQQSSSQLDG